MSNDNAAVFLITTSLLTRCCHRPDQVKQEIGTFLQMLSEVYGIFGLDYTLKLSTRPEKYLGELSQWDDAERALEDALNATGRAWELNEGDGAFYGPKIDIAVMDALRRKFQCATVQLDFQLPQRFKLQYMMEEGYGTPVMVHRCVVDVMNDDVCVLLRAQSSESLCIHSAILGSVERMFAILTEHYAGKWPLWLSPRQVMVVPISESSYEYARHVRSVVRAAVRVNGDGVGVTPRPRDFTWMRIAQTARCRKRSGRHSWRSTTTFWCVRVALQHQVARNDTGGWRGGEEGQHGECAHTGQPRARDVQPG